MSGADQFRSSQSHRGERLRGFDDGGTDPSMMRRRTREKNIDDRRRPVWLEATESFYRKLNRIASACDLSRYEALSKGLDSLLREKQVRESPLNKIIRSPGQSEVFRRTMTQGSRNYWPVSVVKRSTNVPERVLRRAAVDDLYAATMTVEGK